MPYIFPQPPYPNAPVKESLNAKRLWFLYRVAGFRTPELIVLIGKTKKELYNLRARWKVWIDEPMDPVRADGDVERACVIALGFPAPMTFGIEASYAIHRFLRVQFVEGKIPWAAIDALPFGPSSTKGE